MKIKVTYVGDINTELDDKIKKAIENLGAKWYGQGIDCTTKIRDICFHIPEKEKK